eukprot:PITA_35590
MEKDYDALIKNGTWKLVDPSLGTKPIRCKWVYKNKYNVDGSLHKHNATLMTKDDLFMKGNNESYIASIKEELRKSFEMTDLGYVHYYLGIEVTQHLKSIFLSQKKYIGDLLNRFMQKPCEGHWSAAKRVLKYLKGTQDFRIKYTQVDYFILIGYSDSDFDGDKETRVSTLGYAMSLGSGVLSQRSHKQSVPTNSTTKAEYEAAAKATKEIVWLR